VALVGSVVLGVRLLGGGDHPPEDAPFQPNFRLEGGIAALPRTDSEEMPEKHSEAHPEDSPLVPLVAQSEADAVK
jgi:hypothetical protein